MPSCIGLKFDHPGWVYLSMKFHPAYFFFLLLIPVTAFFVAPFFAAALSTSFKGSGICSSSITNLTCSRVKAAASLGRVAGIAVLLEGRWIVFTGAPDGGEPSGQSPPKCFLPGPAGWMYGRLLLPDSTARSYPPGSAWRRKVAHIGWTYIPYNGKGQNVSPPLQQWVYHHKYPPAYRLLVLAAFNGLNHFSKCYFTQVSSFGRDKLSPIYIGPKRPHLRIHPFVFVPIHAWDTKRFIVFQKWWFCFARWYLGKAFLFLICTQSVSARHGSCCATSGLLACFRIFTEYSSRQYCSAFSIVSPTSLPEWIGKVFDHRIPLHLALPPLRQTLLHALWVCNPWYHQVFAGESPLLLNLNLKKEFGFSNGHLMIELCLFYLLSVNKQ